MFLRALVATAALTLADARAPLLAPSSSPTLRPYSRLFSPAPESIVLKPRRANVWLAARDEDHSPRLGLPEENAWGWSKIPPKPSLDVVSPDIGQHASAEAWVLNLIEFIHWTPILPLTLASYSVLVHRDFWLAEFNGVEWRLLMLLLSPMIQFAGGLGAVTMHVYEGWIVAPFKNPITEQIDIYKYNNAWLRETAYRMLFTVQCAGLQMVTLAFLTFGEGNDAAPWWAIGLSIISVLSAYGGDQAAKPVIEPSWAEPFGKGTGSAPAFPLSYWTLVPFILSAMVNGYAYYTIGSSHGVHWAVIAPLVFGAGGLLEGALAETLFNQWLHFVAFAIVNIGAVLQWQAYEQIASSM